ncbi:EAL domain-containing protein [Aeromicrobium sp. P5_D10]
MTSRSRGELRYEIVVILVGLAVVLVSSLRWRLGVPDLNIVTIAALVLVPVAVRFQMSISRGPTDLTLGVSAAALFAGGFDDRATVLPIWSVLVAVSYFAFHRDESGGQFRAAIQVLGGAALIAAAKLTDVGVPPYDQVFAGLLAYFVTISILEILRRLVAGSGSEAKVPRLRWTLTFIIGLAAFYIGCVLAAVHRVETGTPLGVVPSLAVTVIGLSAVVVGQAMRNRELSRSVEALSGAAVTMPWRKEVIAETLSLWGAKGLRVREVRVDKSPGSRSDFSVPLLDGRHVVAERAVGGLPFTQVERHVLEALANMADTSRRESEQREKLRNRANTDGLTGLSTYTYFREVLAEVSRSRSPGESIAIVFIDLDGFKEINDRYGHIAGDRAIQVLAERFLRHTGDSKTVTRYGGDEFAVLVRDVGDYAALTEECERLTALVSRPITVGQNTLRLRASIGSALSSSPEDQLEELVRAADQQMYQRKRAIHAGDKEVTSRIDEGVRQAIVHGRLTTAYQPIVHLDSDAVASLEVLVRYADPQMGSIPPPVIVESAIRLNMLDDMTIQVLDQAIATMIECREEVPGLRSFSINLELEQMMTWTPLLQRIADCNDEHGIGIVIEISEGSIGRWSEANADICWRLQQAGVQIAIDDFGAGFAGLGSLYLPRVDVVKLDRSLLTDLADPRQTLVVTRATAMLNELGFWVVAEGITDLHEATVLREAGATHVQGFLYGMPEDRSATLRRFRDHGLKPLVC